MKYGVSTISTTKQEHKKQIEYLLSQGVDEENIIVITETGKTRANAIIRELKSRNVNANDELILECFDRTGRDIVTVFNLLDWLEENKIKIIVNGNEIDRKSETGETQTLIEATVAELYRIRRSHQSKNIIARDKANGTYKGGRPKIHQKKIEHIQNLFAQGLKPSEISLLTGVNRTTIYKYIAQN